MFCIRVRNDAPAGTERNCIAFSNKRAYQDIQIHVTISVDVTYGACVCTASLLFHLGQYFHASNLGAAGYGTAGKYSANDFGRCHIITQPANDVGDNMMHVLVTFQDHQLIDLDSAGNADATEIIALKID